MISAGLLMFKKIKGTVEILLAHPGGPFFKNKDEGYWTIPKGLAEENEQLLDTAIREFTEETGIVPRPPFIALGMVKQKGGKVVHAWAFENNNETLPLLKSNMFKMEWPPRSGNFKEFQEVDQISYFSIAEALSKINEAQRSFITKLTEELGLSINI